MTPVRNSLALILALISVLVIWVAPAQGQTARETVTSVSVCGNFEGGSFNTHDGITFIRDAPVTCRHTSSDPRASGTTHSVFNGNLDASGSGPVWGFDRFVSDEGGVWLCHFNGQMNNWFQNGHAQLRGEGKYEGRLAKLTIAGGTFTWEIYYPGE